MHEQHNVWSQNARVIRRTLLYHNAQRIVPTQETLTIAKKWGRKHTAQEIADLSTSAATARLEMVIFAEIRPMQWTCYGANCDQKQTFPPFIKSAISMSLARTLCRYWLVKSALCSSEIAFKSFENYHAGLCALSRSLTRLRHTSKSRKCNVWVGNFPHGRTGRQIPGVPEFSHE